MPEFYLVTGCSGGGKSTLLAELAARGERVVEEPGRRIVAQELIGDGSALPWVDMAAFARRAVSVSEADLVRAGRSSKRVFFDRGLLDAAIALEHTVGTPLAETIESKRVYAAPIFLAPPWHDIFTQDHERRHSFAQANAEYDRIHATLLRLKLEFVILPRVSVAERAKFVLKRTSRQGCYLQPNTTLNLSQ